MLTPIRRLLLLAIAATLATETRGERIRVGEERAAPVARESGVLASAGLELAYLERDGYVVLSPGLGYLSPRFELLLSLPVEVLAYDLPPPDRDRALFGLLRARTFLEDGEVGLPLLSKVLSRLRVGRDGDLFRLRGGAIHHSQGHGSVVWRYASTPDVDRRQAGAVLFLGGDSLGLEALVGNILAPQRVSAARGYLRPLLLLAPATGWMRELGERFSIGLGYAADFSAPTDPTAIAADGSYRPDGETAAIVHALADAELLLLDRAWLSTALYTDAGLRHGRASRVGGGGELGALITSRLWAASLSVRLGLRLASDGYRPAEFDAFYEIERVTTFGADVPKASISPPAGLAGVVEASLRLGRWLGLRAQLDDAPGPDNSNLLLGLDLAAGPVRAGAALAQRGFEGRDQLLSLGERTVGLAEIRVETFGPVAIVGRYWRTLRREAGAQRLDHDLLIGVEAGWLFQ